VDDDETVKFVGFHEGEKVHVKWADGRLEIVLVLLLVLVLVLVSKNLGHTGRTVENE
jgi:hypothetical protein